MERKQVRQLLNTLFLIGFLVAFIAYFTSEDRTVFLIISFVSIGIKLAEYILRFIR